jgi:hypothetical protein
VAKLSEHASNKYAKLILIGDSGTGKTGSLISLVKAGYKLRILDMDNGLSILKTLVLKECPELIDNVDSETRRDTYRPSAAGPVCSSPKALVGATELMTKWTDGTTPAQWGEDTFFVLDSLTMLGKAAFEWARGMNPSSKDPRQWYGSAQQAVTNILSMLTGDDFKTNLLILSHITYSEYQDGTTKGHASAIGKAMGPTIASYFDNLLIAETSGSGTLTKRTIRFTPTAQVDAKSPAVFKLQGNSLPLETGLAEIVKQIKSN